MKNFFRYLIFTISIGSGNLLASNLVGEGTVDNPYQISCSNCYTDLDFKNTAKSAVPNNESRYYNIYNLNTQVLKTALAFQFTDWGSGLNMSNSIIVTTKAEHQADFNNYIGWINSGAEKSDIDLDYPPNGAIPATSYAGFIASNPALALQDWVQAHANLGFFTFRGISNVNVTFQNGDVATFAVTGYVSATNFPLLIVVDEDGMLVALLGASATTSHGGGGAGTPGGWTDFTLPSGVTICYGACPIRDGIVTINPGKVEE